LGLSAIEDVSEILIVEDDPGDAFLAEEHLREQSDDSVRTVHAPTLRDALRSISPATSCVLLDLNLPDADGMAALTSLLDVAPSVPIVVLTGLAGRREGVAAVNAGAQDYLEKNELTAGTLWRSVRYAVERRRNVDRDLMLLEAALRREENVRLTRGLLPTPRLSSPDVRWASRYTPASEQALLGGDFIDAVEMPDGALRVVIGDVSGHGPEEAALGACLRIGWRSLVLGGADQTATVASLDALLIAERDSPTMFASLCDVRVERDRDRAVVLSAGHDAPLLITPASVEHLRVAHGGLIGLGLAAGQPTEVELPAEWSLLMFTDGIFEGRSRAGGRLGIDAFVELVRAHWAPSAHGDVLDRLIAAAERENAGPLPDDVALFLLSRSAQR
jgi:serine phosphatase RsbU (regulator of sigma subunit)